MGWPLACLIAAVGRGQEPGGCFRCVRWKPVRSHTRERSLPRGSHRSSWPATSHRETVSRFNRARRMHGGVPRRAHADRAGRPPAPAGGGSGRRFTRRRARPDRCSDAGCRSRSEPERLGNSAARRRGPAGVLRPGPLTPDPGDRAARRRGTQSRTMPAQDAGNTGCRPGSSRDGPAPASTVRRRDSAPGPATGEYAARRRPRQRPVPAVGQPGPAVRDDAPAVIGCVHRLNGSVDAWRRVLECPDTGRGPGAHLIPARRRVPCRSVSRRKSGCVFSGSIRDHARPAMVSSSGAVPNGRTWHTAVWPCPPRRSPNACARSTRG